MSQPFCHIHNHTEYSLLDGANRIPDMVARAGELGMNALAITDHGVMFGVMEFYLECKKAGIKPLLGVEAYVAPQGIAKRGSRADNEFYHLLLLAKDLEGYRNLCHLSSIAALEGYYYKPRIDHDLLRKYSRGLIGTSACLGSEICEELTRGNYDKAQYTAGMYAEIFGEGNFFIELQDHRIPEQADIKDSLIKIARDLKLPLVATNDAHYLCKSDATPHDVLLCIQTGALVKDEKRMRFTTDEFYIKSPDEMSKLFADTPTAIENTQRIADTCDVALDKQRAPMPQPEVPEGMESLQYLRESATAGLLRRVAEPEPYLARLDYELSVIEKTGFSDYILLVKEFAQATRDRGIFFGVRGSAAGSLVSYCVGITDVDPVEYDLTFERFLNPERISMPDIDMDFEDARRDEIIQWVTEKYGKDHVAQIVTFGTLGAKAAIKDCGRVQGYSPQETDRLTKTIPTLPGWTLDRAYKEITEFRQMVDGDPRLTELFHTAKSVEGISRNAGVHAAGVVISKDPLVDYVPLYRGNDGQAVTAYEMGILEKIGLLKMDFLGLSNLTVLARCVDNIKAMELPSGASESAQTQFDISKIPLDDKKTYEMIGRGETIGVFQLEGGGMTRWVQQLKPGNVRELAAMIALYRPGPMEHIPRFIDTKYGRIKPEFLDERMRPILEETYGVIVYQDQVLKLVQALAGFSLGKADVLRRAMGKKDAKGMASMKAEFFEGTASIDICKGTAEKIWELLLPFAGYAFNKAHAICYSLLAYQTGYLKANYPIEYMAALLSVYLSKEDKVASCIEECRRQKIKVLPPDVNYSVGGFSIEKHGASVIRFGLTAIKGVGESLVEGVIAERKLAGPFKHIFEFCERTKPFGLNRTALDALVRAGALDHIEPNRRKLLNHTEAALQYADSQNRSRLAGQDSLFGGQGGPQAVSYPLLPDCPSPSRSERLSMEKEVMGIYVSDHPLRGHERTLQQASSHGCGVVSELEENTSVRLAGVIAGLKPVVTKKGDRMATLVLEDFTGQTSLVVYPKTYEKVSDKLVKDSIIQVIGTVTAGRTEGAREVRVEDIKPLEASLDIGLPGPSNASGTVTLRMRKATETQLRRLRLVIDDHPGDFEMLLHIMDGTDHIPVILVQHVNPVETFKLAIKELLPGSLLETESSAYHSGHP